MTDVTKLKRDIEIVQRALSRDKEGYDQDGYDSDGKDRYGRSRLMMEESAKYDRMAFDSLTPEQQELVWKAHAIHLKYEGKAVEWESLPTEIKRKSSFFEDWVAHSPITKHAWLEAAWITKEEKEITYAAFDVMLEAQKKFDPYYKRGSH